MAAKVKKGDRVVVLAGRDKGKEGETVRIQESRPISKRKRWVVLLEGAEAAQAAGD